MYGAGTGSNAPAGDAGSSGDAGGSGANADGGNAGSRAGSSPAMKKADPRRVGPLRKNWAGSGRSGRNLPRPSCEIADEKEVCMGPSS